MKKSTQVSVSLILAMAAGVTAPGCGCNGRRCEDAYGNPLPDSSCRAGGYGGARWVSTGGFGGYSGSGGSFGG